MKKGIVLVAFLVSSMFGNSINYEFLGDVDLGNYFSSHLFEFLNDKELNVGVREVMLSSHAGPDKDFSGWINYKFYKPAGVEASLDIDTAPNATLRINMKFRGDKNPIFDYVFPSKTVYNSYLLQQDDIYATNYNKGLAVKVDNVGNFVLFDPDKSGWIYMSIIEDSVNWSSTSERPYQVAVNLYYKFYLVDEVKFLEWLSTQQFQFNGKGNPIPETEYLRVIPKKSVEEKVILPTINPSFISYPLRSFIPNGYFVQIGTGANDWVYLQYGTNSLFKMEGVDFNKKVIKWLPIDLKDCFSFIKVENNKISFGEYLSESCPVDLPTLKNVENKSKDFSIFVHYGEKADEWLLFSSPNSINKLSFERGSLWRNVTQCFKYSVVTPQKIVVIGKEEVSDSICYELSTELFDKSKIKMEENSGYNSSVQEISSISSYNSEESSSISGNENEILERLGNKKFSREELDYSGILLDGENLIIFDKTSNSIFLFKKEQDGYKKVDITLCFTNVNINEEEIIIGEVKEECKDYPLISSMESFESSSDSEPSFASSSRVNGEYSYYSSDFSYSSFSTSPSLLPIPSGG